MSNQPVEGDFRVKGEVAEFFYQGKWMSCDLRSPYERGRADMLAELNEFRQRIPGFIDPRGLQPVSFQFVDTQEFLEHPHIKQFMEDKNSVSLMKDRNAILVKTKENYHFLVGFVKDPDSLNLPMRPKKKQQENN